MFEGNQQGNVKYKSAERGVVHREYDVKRQRDDACDCRGNDVIGGDGRYKRDCERNQCRGPVDAEHQSDKTGEAFASFEFSVDGVHVSDDGKRSRDDSNPWDVRKQCFGENVGEDGFENIKAAC